MPFQFVLRGLFGISANRSILYHISGAVSTDLRCLFSGYGQGRPAESVLCVFYQDARMEPDLSEGISVHSSYDFLMKLSARSLIRCR